MLTRDLLRRYKAECRLYGDSMEEYVDTGRCVVPHGSDRAVRTWRSKRFFAGLYEQPCGAMRLSVNRVEIDTKTGDWKDGISWDELQRIKGECGFGDVWAVEVFPPSIHLVYLANIRHLFLLSDPPTYAWKVGKWA